MSTATGHAENFSGSGLVEPAVDTWVSGFPGALAILNDCSSGVASIGERRPLNLNPISKPLPALIHSPRSGSKLRFSTCSCTRVPYLPRLGGGFRVLVCLGAFGPCSLGCGV